MANLKRRRKGMAGNVLQVFLSDKYLLLQTAIAVKLETVILTFFHPIFGTNNWAQQYTWNHKCQLKIMIMLKRKEPAVASVPPVSTWDLISDMIPPPPADAKVIVTTSNMSFLQQLKYNFKIFK